MRKKDQENNKLKVEIDSLKIHNQHLVNSVEEKTNIIKSLEMDKEDLKKGNSFLTTMLEKLMGVKNINNLSTE